MVEYLFWIIQALVAGLGMVLWSGFQEMKESLRNMKQEISDHKLEAAKEYVTNSALEKAMETITKHIDSLFAKLDKIDDKLDHKADKGSA